MKPREFAVKHDRMILKLVDGVELMGSIGFIIMLIFELVVNWHTDRE